MLNRNRIHLLRHGQFLRGKIDNDGPLTSAGRRQARYAAKRFRDYGIGRVYSSDLQRAGETAEIIVEQLSLRAVKAVPLLREMLPTRVAGVHVPLQSRRSAQQRIEEILGQFLSQPTRSGDALLVCHGNLIRAVLCRVLQTPITKWAELAVFNCGLTTFGFRDSGELCLECFNDSGHLPDELKTHS